MEPGWGREGGAESGWGMEAGAETISSEAGQGDPPGVGWIHHGVQGGPGIWSGWMGQLPSGCRVDRGPGQTGGSVTPRGCKVSAGRSRG